MEPGAVQPPHELVARLGREALATRDLDAVLALALGESAAAVGADLGCVTESPGPGEDFEIRTLHGPWRGVVVGERFGRASSQTAADLAALRSVVVADIQAHPALSRSGPLTMSGAVAAVFVPIFAAGEVLGSFALCWRAPRAVGDAERSALEAVANVLAAAIARERSDRELRTTNARLAAVLEHASAAISMKDLDGRVVLANDRFAELCRSDGPPEGRTVRELFAPEVAERLQRNDERVLEAGAPLEMEEFVPLEDGVHTFLSLKFPLLGEDGRPYGVGGVSTDITDRVIAERERRRLETRLRQAERLETVGRLAGGIAHDFNNLLAVILSYATFVHDDVEPDSPTAADVEQIREAARRAAALTGRLLLFSRREPGRLEVIDLGATVDEMARLVARTLGPGVRLRTEIDPETWPVRVDVGEIEQVLLNLAVNARDAMPESGGEVVMRTQNVVLDGDRADGGVGPAVRGAFVRLTVEDTGAGMDADTAARAFEPFFTTKPPGAGAGLGLATVYGTITRSGGHLEIETRPGAGTAVVIDLPRAAGTPGARDDLVAPPPRGHGERILVVEDEAAVRAAAVRILERAGYDVHEAASGPEALELVRSAGPADLLLSDVVMPGMHGPELADRLRSETPGVRVVFMSGYADEVLRSRGDTTLGARMLEKPFTADVLLRAVREQLDAER